MEHWESLCPGGYRFVWDEALFPPGTDTFLLSSLPRLRPGLRVCELCCGTGLLSLLLLQRQPALTVAGVDLCSDAVSLARRAAAENGLTDRLTFLQGDLRRPEQLPQSGTWDLTVCNPPYYPLSSGRVSPDPARREARSEVSCTLEEVCAAAARLLRWGGAFCLVHKPERLTDLVCALRQAGLEPKRLRFAVPRPGAAPSLVLAEGRRGGRPGLRWEPALCLHRADGTETAEMDQIYFRDRR